MDPLTNASLRRVELILWIDCVADVLSKEADGLDVHETPHAVQVQPKALPENEVLHNHIEKSVYNCRMTKKHLKTHIEPVVAV